MEPVPASLLSLPPGGPGRRALAVRLGWAAAVLVLGSCRCAPPLTQVPPAELVPTPARLTFAPTYLGHEAAAVLVVDNRGGALAAAGVSVSAPFTVDADHLELHGGESASLRVAFVPAHAGHVTGVLLLGALEVPIDADGLEVPTCTASSACATARFEPAAGLCVEATLSDGTACQTSCVAGTCASGVCLGQLRGCDDADACTVDACDEAAGCSHSPRACPAPTNPCQVARCDAAAGCGAEDVPDGTLCGPDDCLDTRVSVCITGHCVSRARPDTGRCANRWVPSQLTGRHGHAVATDGARQRVVLFGGRRHDFLANGAPPLFDDTWEWDGTRWTQRTPVAAPSPRWGHGLAFDPARRRVMLFGGTGAAGQALSDTWEWDGTTWVERSPAVHPPALSQAPLTGSTGAMATDSARGRVLLVAPSTTSSSLETWEWAQARWTQRTPATSPVLEAPTMTDDPHRGRVVLFGGYGTSQTWEWDGATWSQRAPAHAPPWRRDTALAYDPVSQRVVLFGGQNGGHLSDTWEWDGEDWTARGSGGPQLRASHAMALDPVRGKVLLVGGEYSQEYADTWTWDGTTWAAVVQTPSARVAATLASDPVLQRVVLFGGLADLVKDDTWEWAGGQWRALPTAIAPPARVEAAMVFDEVSARLLLFGGHDGNAALGDTWTLAGTTWVEQRVTPAPAARHQHALAWDPLRRRAVLFGGLGAQLFNDTWEWDGARWVERTPLASPPAREGHVLAWDAASQRILLQGGYDDVQGLTLGDTWAWDGAQWLQLSPTSAPAAGSGMAAACDPVRQRVVWFGGVETWEWDGATWLLRRPVSAPSFRVYPSLAWDPASARVLLFGGQHGGLFSETWLFLP